MFQSQLMEAIEVAKKEMLELIQHLFEEHAHDSHTCDVPWHRVVPVAADDWVAVDHLVYQLLLLRLETDGNMADEIGMTMQCLNGRNEEATVAHMRQLTRHQKVGAVINIALKLDMEMRLNGKREGDATVYIGFWAQECRNYLMDRLDMQRSSNDILRRAHEEKSRKSH
jgi:hypothetical protein